MFHKRPKSWRFVPLNLFWHSKDNIANLYKGRWPLCASVSLWQPGDLLNQSFPFGLKAGVTLCWIMRYRHCAMCLGLAGVDQNRCQRFGWEYLNFSSVRFLMVRQTSNESLGKLSFRWALRTWHDLWGTQLSPWGLCPPAHECARAVGIKSKPAEHVLL